MARAASAGITTLAVTDHDTTAGLAEARRAAVSHGLMFIDGIEITAVEDGRDVHILGYYFDPDAPHLASFLEVQRADRIRRVHEIAARLSELGCPIDPDPIISAARGRSVGRPQIADALIAGGFAENRDKAFDLYLGQAGKAFVPRRGPSAADVVHVIADAGGIASFAHPGLTRRDDLIPQLVAAGLAALEVRHSDHDALTEMHYRELARLNHLEVSGGSDYHADTTRRGPCLGVVVLPAEDFARLQARAPQRRRAG